MWPALRQAASRRRQEPCGDAQAACGPVLRTPLASRPRPACGALGLPPSLRARSVGRGGEAQNAFCSSYTLNSARTNDAGIWTAIITNAAHLSPGILSSNAFLTVVVPPTNQTVTAGSDVAMRVAAFGSGAIGYQWAFNGANIANATNSTLLVTNVQAANDGIYSVTVTAPGNPGTPPVLPATYNASLSLDGVPRFASPELLGGGGFTALIRGGILNQSYIVEVSTNLTNWAVLSTVTYTNNPTPFSDSGVTGSRQRFYRARQSP